MAGNRPTIDIEGNITFPDNIEDCTDSYLHNLALSYYECLKDVPNALPKKILLFGTKNSVDFQQELQHDSYYTHELIEKIDNDPTYEFRPNMTTKTYTYKGVTIYFLVENDLLDEDGIVIPSVNLIQQSFGLGGKPDEDENS